MKSLTRNTHLTNMLIGFAFILLILMSLFSCTKKELDWKDEFGESLSNYKNSYVSEGSALLSGDTIIDSKTLIAVGLPVLLKEASSDEVMIYGEVDPSLLEQYDQLQGSKSLPFEKGAFEVADSGMIRVQPGLTISKDSLKINLVNANGMQNGQVYVIPVRLKVVQGQAELKSAYMVLKMSVKVGVVTGWFDQFKWVANFTNTAPYPPTFISGRINNTSTNGVHNGPEKIQFSAKISHDLSQDLNAEIEANIADSVIEMYNTLKTVKSKAIPSDSYTVIKQNVNIYSGSFTSQDSFAISIDYNKLKELPTDSIYLLVMELVHKDDSKYKLNKEDQRHRAFIEITQRVYESGNVATGNPELLGQEINNSGWKIDGDPNFTHPNFPIENLLDGDINTFWMTNSPNPFEMLIDMGKNQQLAGFKLVEQYGTLQSSIVRFEIHSSDDGLTWINQGMYLGDPRDYTTNIQNPSIRNVKFHTPVQAQYIKFTILSGGNGLPAFADLIGIE